MLLVGLDLDNTLADYDAVFAAAAREEGFLPSGGPLAKRAVRDAVRGLPAGEDRWQELQARVYGPLLDRARPVAGALDFLRFCCERGVRCAVVSHKTRFAARDTERRHDLRQGALRWLAANGFFDPAASPLAPGDVYFADSRADKAARIAVLGCTHFVDDLEEVFAEPGFPPATQGILLGPDGAGRMLPGVLALPGWPEVARRLAEARHARA